MVTKVKTENEAAEEVDGGITPPVTSEAPAKDDPVDPKATPKEEPKKDDKKPSLPTNLPPVKEKDWEELSAGAKVERIRVVIKKVRVEIAELCRKAGIGTSKMDEKYF